jgi:hypothetical protein
MVAFFHQLADLLLMQPGIMAFWEWARTNSPREKANTLDSQEEFVRME